MWEHFQLVQVFGGSRFRFFTFRGYFEFGGKIKSTAFAFFTFHPYFSAHHFGNAFADGESQTGSTIFSAGGPVFLGEGIEQFPGLVLIDANTGIPYPEFESNEKVMHIQDFNGNAYFTFFGEFECVGGKVG